LEDPASHLNSIFQSFTVFHNYALIYSQSYSTPSFDIPLTAHHTSYISFATLSDCRHVTCHCH
jgi:hypothetical protein